MPNTHTLCHFCIGRCRDAARIDVYRGGPPGDLSSHEWYTLRAELPTYGHAILADKPYLIFTIMAVMLDVVAVMSRAAVAGGQHLPHQAPAVCCAPAV